MTEDNISFFTPLLKFVDHKTGNEISLENEYPYNLKEPYCNDEVIVKFHECVSMVSSNPFNERTSPNDKEITEIYLYNNNGSYYWDFKRINRKNNNRFGNMRKELCDLSGIPCKKKPIKPIETIFGRGSL